MRVREIIPNMFFFFTLFTLVFPLKGFPMAHSACLLPSSNNFVEQDTSCQKNQGRLCLKKTRKQRQAQNKNKIKQANRLHSKPSKQVNKNKLDRSRSFSYFGVCCILYSSIGDFSTQYGYKLYPFHLIFGIVTILWIFSIWYQTVYNIKVRWFLTRKQLGTSVSHCFPPGRGLTNNTSSFKTSSIWRNPLLRDAKTNNPVR